MGGKVLEYKGEKFINEANREVATNLIKSEKLTDQEIAHVCGLELKDVQKLREELNGHSMSGAVEKLVNEERAEERKETATQMIIDGEPEDKILRYSRLSKKELDALREELTAKV